MCVSCLLEKTKKSQIEGIRSYWIVRYYCVRVPHHFRKMMMMLGSLFLLQSRQPVIWISSSREERKKRGKKNKTIARGHLEMASLRWSKDQPPFNLHGQISTYPSLFNYQTFQSVFAFLKNSYIYLPLILSAQKHTHTQIKGGQKRINSNHAWKSNKRQSFWVGETFFFYVLLESQEWAHNHTHEKRSGEKKKWTNGLRIEGRRPIHSHPIKKTKRNIGILVVVLLPFCCLVCASSWTL